MLAMLEAASWSSTSSCARPVKKWQKPLGACLHVSARVCTFPGTNSMLCEWVGKGEVRVLIEVPDGINHQLVQAGLRRKSLRMTVDLRAREGW